MRKLGLPDEEWETVSPRGRRRLFDGERHVSCVKMSGENADEVCPFGVIRDVDAY